MCFFYTCNLRAYLISPTFEEFIDTPDQVIKRGAPMYIAKLLKIGR